MYEQLYVMQLDEAYGDPKMDDVVALLGNVHKRSVDQRLLRGTPRDGRSAQPLRPELLRSGLTRGRCGLRAGSRGLGELVDQTVRGHDQVVPQLPVEFRGQRQFVQRCPHMPQPGVPLGLADHEMPVPHPQPRVAAPLVVGGRAAPVLHQEQPEVLLGRAEVPARVDGAQFGVGGHLLIEPVHQAPERRLPADS